MMKITQEFFLKKVLIFEKKVILVAERKVEFIGLLYMLLFKNYKVFRYIRKETDSINALRNHDNFENICF